VEEEEGGGSRPDQQEAGNDLATVLAGGEGASGTKKGRGRGDRWAPAIVLGSAGSNGLNRFQIRTVQK
jgi:hypothetical protein